MGHGGTSYTHQPLFTIESKRLGTVEDIEITKRLIDAGELLGIKVQDHIIVLRNGWTSMREEGVV